jgi:hypothetical protein
MNYIVEYLFNNKITKCYEITNRYCKKLNTFRQYERTIQKNITVGLLLPNKSGKLILFNQRNIMIITKQG